MWNRLERHRLLAGIVLIVTGAVMLGFVLLGGLGEWQERIADYPESAFKSLLELSFWGPVLVLLSGGFLAAGIMFAYPNEMKAVTTELPTAKREMQLEPLTAPEFAWSAYKKLIMGILLTIFGFTYQVVGAWVLWDKAYTWWWQTEIAKYGSLLVWLLFILSLTSLIIGAKLLYQDSKLHQKKRD